MTDVLIYQLAPDAGVESGSPFSLKALRAATYKGIAYHTKVVAFSELRKVAPERQKLPVAEIAGERVIDSTPILARLDQYKPDPSLYPGDPRARAWCHLMEDWADESLSGFTGYFRWLIDEYFEALSKDNFRSMPVPVRWVVPQVARSTVRRQLRARGVGRLDKASALQQFEEHLRAVDDLIVPDGYILGNQLTAADIAIFCQLRIISVPYVKEPRDIMIRYPKLIAYLKRIDERTKPEKSDPIPF